MARYIDLDKLLASIDVRNGRLPLWLAEIISDECETANVAPVRCGDTFYYVYLSDDKKRYEIDELVAEEVSDKRVWTDNGLCEIGIDEFGKFAFLDYEKAKKTAEKLNGEKNGEKHN